MNDIKAVAFDIDGTMYRSCLLWLKSAPYFLSRLHFFANFAAVRSALHGANFQGDFFDAQARLLAERLKIDDKAAAAKIRSFVYDGMRHCFEKISVFDGLKDLVVELKEKGFRLGILSDFPPEQKGNLWNLLPYFDVCVSSEKCGALKPSPIPFLALAKALDCEPREILYVGNSLKLDVLGAKNVGMKTAHIVPSWKRFLRLRASPADILFCKYAELQKILLRG